MNALAADVMQALALIDDNVDMDELREHHPDFPDDTLADVVRGLRYLREWIIKNDR